MVAYAKDAASRGLSPEGDLRGPTWEHVESPGVDGTIHANGLALKKKTTMLI